MFEKNQNVRVSLARKHFYGHTKNVMSQKIPSGFQVNLSNVTVIHWI